MKNRHLKLFSEKFIKNVDRVTKDHDKNLFETINTLIENNTEDISPNDLLKKLLQQNGMYNGSFYVSVDGLDFLGFNLEYRCEESFKLPGREEGNFMKVFVDKFDGRVALVCFMYGDSFCPFLCNYINTENLVVEDNIVYRITDKL